MVTPYFESTSRNNAILDHALFYATELGWPVFPCKPDGKDAKRPLIQGGCLSASADPQQIRKWWATFPNALIGLPTGSKSGLFVLDIDNKNGKDGFSAWEEISARFGNTDQCLMATTANNGLHIYFSYPTDGTVLKNTASKIGTGIDSRGEGGYVIAPPSQLSNGGTYQWKW